MLFIMYHVPLVYSSQCIYYVSREKWHQMKDGEILHSIVYSLLMHLSLHFDL